MDPQHKRFKLPRLLTRLALLTGGLSAVSPGVASAADTLTPPVVNLTLSAGQSTTVNKLLHLDGLPARADIIVAIDTSFSMANAIAQAKADAITICNNVKNAIPGARFAVVDFEDYPGMPLGSPGDVAYVLLTPGYVSDCATFSAAIATMVADGGGDNPQAYNRVFFEAYDSAGGTNLLVTTRDPQATQFLVVLGDAEPHSATAFGSCPARPPSDFGRNNVAGGGDDLDTTVTIPGLAAADIKLLMIRYLSSGLTVTLQCYEDLAAATGGDAVDSTDAGDIDDFIIAEAEQVPYTVNLMVSPACPLGITFNPAPPYGPFTGPQDIPFTETITAPTVPGVFSCLVTAVLTPGGPTTAVQTVTVTVTPGPPATLTLEPPADANEVLTEHCVTATVRDAFGNRVPNAAVQFTVSGANTASGTVVTGPDGRATFCYTGANVGADLITARVPGTPAIATATKLWVAPTVDHYKCYKAHQKWPKHQQTVVTIQDQFNNAPQRVVVDKLDDMCNPVSKNGEGLVQPEAHFKSYTVKKHRDRRDDDDDDGDDGDDDDGDRDDDDNGDHRKHRSSDRRDGKGTDHDDDDDDGDDDDGDDDDSDFGRTVVVANQFGQEELKVGKREKLLAPSSKSLIPPARPGADPGAPPPFIDHYVCYRAEHKRSPIGPVTLEDQFRREQVWVDDARLFCNPVRKEHAGVVTEILPRPSATPDRLVCYDIKSRKRTERLVNMRDQFTNAILKVEKAESLCVPSTLLDTQPPLP